MILDKLMETKDLRIYIDLRIKHLKNREMKQKRILSIPKEHRNNLAQREFGRIRELQKLKSLIKHLKDESKRYWREAYADKEVQNGTKRRALK